MPRFKDQAICLRHLEWSETSQVVSLLTQERGKVRGLAKGSKRQSPSSVQRFSGGIELLTAGQVIATTRPSGGLASVTEWDLQNDYFGLRQNLRAQQLAMYAADLCDALLAELDPHANTFAAMSGLLDVLGATDPASESQSAEWERALLQFQWHLLEDCGYRPELNRDARNGGELRNGKAYTFDPIAGGLTSDGGSVDWRVRASTVAVLRSLAVSGSSDDESTLGHAELESVKRANRLLCVYARAILDKELPTMRVVLAK